MSARGTLPTPAPTPAMKVEGKSGSVIGGTPRASAIQATQKISRSYRPGGMLDSQVDSQAWLDQVTSGITMSDTLPTANDNEADDDPSLFSSDYINNSSDVEFVDALPPSKKPKLESPADEAISSLHKHIDILASELAAAVHQCDELTNKLERVQQQWSDAERKVVQTKKDLDAANSANRHLRVLARTLGETLINHGPGYPDCFCKNQQPL
ncbi:hypothetical protein H0H93_006378 [Arthromyces matolae]|nr:hypothetical protein H0H93_006378 [Arthromyces matolae]